MSDACASVVDPLDLGGLAAAAAALEMPMAHDRKGILRGEAGILLDGLLTRCAGRQGALDVAIGECLAALDTGGRAIDLGYGGIGDYARERLGIAARTAQKMARLARELRERPLLRAAVWTGEVTARKAETVLPVARRETEEWWVARARTETVRALQAAVKGAAGPEDEGWERVSVTLAPEARETLDKALALAGKLLGPTAPKWQRLEAICEEYLGAHEPGDEGARNGILHAPIDNWLEPLEENLEKETAQWAFLEQAQPVAAPVPGADTERDPWLLHAELQRLMALRNQSDEALGRFANLFRTLGLWRDAQFASFGHYCSERLGMAERTVEQRISLERRLQVLPALRRAMRDGRISYEKARLVAWQATDSTVEEWIDGAEGMTCIALRRKLEAEEEAQMCTRGDFDFRAPQRVRVLLAETFAATRKAARAWLAPGECLRVIAQHFIDTWETALAERNTLQRRVLARDRALCQVPGCSRAATHAHHIDFRSQGGSDDPSNLVSLCAAHHLQGVHMGRIRVRGTAPDNLRWELGTRPGRAPLVQVPANPAARKEVA